MSGDKDAGLAATGSGGSGSSAAGAGECALACETGLVCERVGSPACLDPNWAEWPMSNAEVDVTAGAPNLESYKDNGDGTVTDNVTGLSWQQSVPTTTYAREAAVAYCAGLSLAGHTNWRLPSYVELFSVVDPGAFSPSVDAAVFPSTPSDYFWSSTPFAAASGSAWAVDFTSGDPSGLVVSLANYVRCVR